MIGPVAALMFADLFKKITILEKRNVLNYKESDKRSLQIILSERAWRTLDKIGIERQVRELCNPLSGRVQHISSELKKEEKYGNDNERIFCVSRKDLNHYLLQLAINHPKINFENRSELIEVAPLTKTIKYKSGDKLFSSQYDLLIGAEGANSYLAQFLNPDNKRECELENYTYKETRIYRNDLSSSSFHYYHCKDFMSGAFPLNSSGDFSFFYVYKNDKEPYILANENWSNLNSNNPLVLDSYSLSVRDELRKLESGRLGSIKNKKWHYQNSIILLGDCAHTILPFMGQGLNIGLEDVYLFYNFFKTSPQNFELFCNNRKESTDAMTEISQNQFHYLTGQLTSKQREIKHKKEAYYKIMGIRNLYSSCAFTFENIQEIYSRDKKIEEICVSDIPKSTESK